MKRLRYAVALLAVMATALSATACGGDDGAQQNAKGELEIWIRQAAGSDSAKTAERLAQAFTQASGVPTKVVAIFDDFETKLQQQGAQHKLPDIVINDTAQLGNMQSQGWLRQVDKSTFAGADKISERAWKAATATDGKYYGVPFSAQAFLLLVRADWRKKLNLPEPKTWADLAALGAAFTKNDPDGNGKADTAGFDIPGTTQRGYMSWYASSYIWGNGGDFVAPAGTGKWKPAVGDAKSVEAVKWLQDRFCVDKSVNPGAVNVNTTTAHEVFEKNQAGIYLVGPYVLARFVKSLGSDKVEAIALPAGPSGGPGALAEGENVYLMAGSDNEAGQKKFAEYATSVDGQKIGMNADDPGAIVRLSVNTGVDMASVRKDPRWLAFQKVYDEAGVYSPPVPNWAPFRQTAADAINAVMADCGADVQAAMNKLAGQLGDLLSKQNALA
ncbi:multiple sugar transport system substrate-binding protein [Hamadaea flava]|uniref:Extracellular solute-binding protein n=1 Tax=Hamadaea flava TaxID=1742688 RepID=A0ABV8LQK5_9ACTN|nr:extracellular solute-binding protein [Hamadaea flava]MCP2322583.1 multiple sugar transport system substrate-binding protein [Hamadaea flava]